MSLSESRRKTEQKDLPPDGAWSAADLPAEGIQWQASYHLRLRPTRRRLRGCLSFFACWYSTCSAEDNQQTNCIWKLDNNSATTMANVMRAICSCQLLPASCKQNGAARRRKEGRTDERRSSCVRQSESWQLCSLGRRRRRRRHGIRRWLSFCSVLFELASNDC